MKVEEDDDLGLLLILGAPAEVSLSVGLKKKISDIDLIKSMIKDYAETYIKNKEWEGGPCNTEWINKYYSFFLTSKSNVLSAWKPTVCINIDLDSVGSLELGFSLRNKKCISISWGDVAENAHGSKVTDWVKENIMDKRMKYDDVISYLSLDMKYDLYFNSIEEYKMKNIKENKDHDSIRKAMDNLGYKMGQLKRWGEFVNRSRIGVDPNNGIRYGKSLKSGIREYFYYLLDDGWEHKVSGYKPTFIERVDFHKFIPKDIDMNSFFGELISELKQIQVRMEDENFKVLFLVWFNTASQQDNNPITHKNDDYKFKGIGPLKSKDRSVTRYFESSGLSPDDYFLAQIEYIFI